MAAKSKIEWTEQTWNPVTGCTKVSPGCKHCYAEVFARRLMKMGAGGYSNGFALTLHPDRLLIPLKRRTPTTYFVNSMSDLFHSKIPDSYIDKVFATIEKAPQHRFQILTKRAERMAEYCGKAALGAGIDKALLRELLDMKGQKNARYFIQNRLARHLKKELGDPYFTVFFIKPSESRRALWLVHASKHPTARDAMVRTHWAVANASISHGPEGLGMLGFAATDDSSIPLPLEFDPAALQRVKAGLKHDLRPTILNEFGHKPILLSDMKMLALNAGVMGTFEHFNDVVLSAAEDREVQILTSAGRPKRPGAKLSSDDRIQVPEIPPLLLLMGLDLPKK